MRSISWFATVIASFAGPAGTGMLAAQETVRVSVSSSGAEGYKDSGRGNLSPDGRIVAFQSDAWNLIPGDYNGFSDVFVHDLQSGTTEIVSVSSNGTLGNLWSYVGYSRSISDDNSLVVFTSDATNFDPTDTNQNEDVYLRDRTSGTTTLVSLGSSGNLGNSWSFTGGMSGDGNIVCFGSYSDNLVPNDKNRSEDMFVRDIAAGTTERISVSSAGVEGNSSCFFPAISHDGRFVAYASYASNLVPGDTNGDVDIFLRDRQLGTTECVSVDPGGIPAGGGCWYPTISGDGMLVAFESSASNLISGDSNQRRDIFVRDRAAGTTTRVSVDSSGLQGDLDSYDSSIAPGGRFVVFASDATTLIAGDTNGATDVFEHDLVTGSTIRVSVDSSGTEANGASDFPDVSESGRQTVFRSAASNLVSADRNKVLDDFVHDRCITLASWANYGAGFPGTNGVPTLTSRQLPSFGTTVTVDLANSLGQPTLGALVVGVQRANLPTNRGGDLLVQPALTVPVYFSFGAASFTGAIPDDFGLCGATVDLQGIEADPGAAYGLSFSEGLELVIGT